MNRSIVRRAGRSLLVALAFATIVVARTQASPPSALERVVATATQQAGSKSGHATIKSRQDLARYLRETAPGKSPLDRLSAGGRARFLASLKFGRLGLIAFRFTDLRTELSAGEIFSILSLFGAQREVAVIEGATPVAAPDTGSVSATGSPALRARYIAFARLPTSMDLSSQSVVRAFGAKYRADFSSEQGAISVARSTRADLDVLYQAADLASFYSQDALYLHDMQLDLDELSRRHAATQIQYEEMYTTLINDRDFAEARILSRVHPAPLMRPMPQFKDESTGDGPSEVVLSPDGRMLTRRRFAFERGGQIIIVASPGCGFCQEAVREIEDDPLLRTAFRMHATWIVPPDSVIGEFSAVGEWNRAHPSEQMVFAYRLQEWPLLDRWGQTPTFYFFKDGREITRIDGWYGPPGEPNLRSALRRIGLL